jgi:hypothetical protein
VLNYGINNNNLVLQSIESSQAYLWTVTNHPFILTAGARTTGGAEGGNRGKKDGQTGRLEAPPHKLRKWEFARALHTLSRWENYWEEAAFRGVFFYSYMQILRYWIRLCASDHRLPH